MFKNGRIYEGMFENDHIVDFPAFEMDGMITPDITKIRTHTPQNSGDNVQFLIPSLKALNSHWLKVRCDLQVADLGVNNGLLV